MMRTAIGVSFLVAAVLGGVMACSGDSKDEATGKSGSGGTGGASSDDGVVSVRCLESRDCPSGQKCAAQICVDADFCEFTSDCEDGLVCDVDAGVCVTCRDDRDCSVGSGGSGGRGGSGGSSSQSGSNTGGSNAGLCASKMNSCVDAQTVTGCDPATGMDFIVNCEEDVPEGLTNLGCGLSSDGVQACLLDFADPACWEGARAFAPCAGLTTQEDVIGFYLGCFTDMNDARTVIPCYVDFVDEVAGTVDCIAADEACLPPLGGGGAPSDGDAGPGAGGDSGAGGGG